MTFCQLGRGLTDHEITKRLLMSLADRFDEPVHFIPAIKFLPACEWQYRGVLEVNIRG
jgi:hypothetical protein